MNGLVATVGVFSIFGGFAAAGLRQSDSILRLSDDALTNASDTITLAGFRVGGVGRVNDGVLELNIATLDNPAPSVRALREFSGALDQLALGNGASSIRITGSAVLNDGFFNSRTAERFGFSFEQLDDATVVLRRDLQ